MIETIVGFGIFISGFKFHAFEKEKAENKLEYIKQTDQEYYKKITSDEDSTARLEFYAQYEKKGNSLLLAGGLILLVLAFNTSIPLVLILMLTTQKKEETEIMAGEVLSGSEQPPGSNV